jgi:pimeloyl-ACP methyl ester carboxylesterase
MTTTRCLFLQGLLLLLLMTSLIKGLVSPFANGWNSWRSPSMTLESSSSSTLTTTPTTNVGQQRRILPNTANRVHLIVLVHGWMGDSSELGYLHKALEKKAAVVQESHPETFYLVYSAKDNDGRTSDGIAAGGKRLATEVNRLIQDVADQVPKDKRKGISLSFVGNSMGGLLARYAVSEIPSLQTDSVSAESIQVESRVFCTTATPHLGVSQHTYLPLPRSIEYVVANVMQPTGRDLFRYTNVIENLATDPIFVAPLQRFRKRIAYANAYQTDFQVPTATAAFLSSTNSAHRRLEILKDNAFVSLAVETPIDVKLLESRMTKSSSQPASSDELARRLDALGWTKVLCLPPLPSIPLPFWSTTNTCKNEYTSSELRKTYAGISGRLYLPIGHTVSVANAKNAFYASVNSGGQPIMDQLADSLIEEIGLE